VGSGFLANAMATMIYDIPALPGLDIQKLDILCNVALKVIKEFSYIELTDILPKALEFLDDAILMDISSEGGLRIPLPTSKTRRA
jgi:hypothetical protein